MTAITDVFRGSETKQTRVRSGWQVITEIQKRLPVLQCLAIVAGVAYGAAKVPGFASRPNLTTIAVLASFLALAALGQTVVVILGGIDLSVPNLIALGAVLIPYAAQTLHVPFLAAAAVGIMAAAAVGATSGWISYYVGVHPMMVTLAVGTCVQGCVLVATRGGSLSAPVPLWIGEASLPTGTTFGIGIPPIISFWIVITIVSSVFFYRTRMGRRIYAVGINPRAASLALVRPERVWIAAFALSAACGAVVGVVLAGFSGTGDVLLGEPYLFQALAAIVVGGTAGSGTGDFLRTGVGALFLITLSTLLISLNNDPADIQILSGALIFVVVLIYSRERSASSRI